jgi:spore germination cell wall hydrolase CwlJ-like protein
MPLVRTLAAIFALVLLTTVPSGRSHGTSLTDDPLSCLALAIYWESKAESEEGMLAVGSVVMNRVAHPEFPDDVCAVVTEGGREPPCQFSWWCDGRSDVPTEASGWQAAGRAALQTLRDPPADATGGALFFHDYRIETPWVRPRQRTAQIGRHVFYR